MTDKDESILHWEGRQWIWDSVADYWIDADTLEDASIEIFERLEEMWQNQMEG